eukprot:Lithocolla_globosa_v1_NODE_1807_length_2321_cov_196.591792.p2 type:complete len:121 gc:universal NODE_1807_length_2321_cov_196.591792:1476-1838(+)
MGTMARAKPASKITCITKRYTSKMCANAEHDEPFLLLNTLVICFWVTKLANVDAVSLLNLAVGTMADENGFPSPFQHHGLANRNISQLDFNGTCSQHSVRGTKHLNHSGNNLLRTKETQH